MRERDQMEENVAPTVLAATFVKNSRASEAAIRTRPCSWERKGYARKTGITTEQAQRCDFVGPIRLTIRG